MTTEPELPELEHARRRLYSSRGARPSTTTRQSRSTGRPSSHRTSTPSTSTTSTTSAPAAPVRTALAGSNTATDPRRNLIPEQYQTLWITTRRSSRSQPSKGLAGCVSLPGSSLSEREHTGSVKAIASPNRQTLRTLWKTASVPHVPASPCRQVGCPGLRPCPLHPDPKPWADSKARRQANGLTLSSHAEAKRRARILRRYGALCHVCHEPFADEVDHVIPLAEGGADDEDNLRPIHRRPCHEQKTKEERRRGQARARARGRG